MKDKIKQLSFGAFRFASRFGIHVLPSHYYVPIASVQELRATKERWAQPSALHGVEVDLDQQAMKLEQVCLPYQEEYAGNHVYLDATRDLFGPGFGYIEAQALHCVLRHTKPSRVIEVGSGVSTACMVHALRLNQAETGDDFELTCIEPYPSPPLQALDHVELIQSPVQSVPPKYFESLRHGDFLFIDSSHSVRPGSDVVYLVLEILPRLAPGITIHVHDIYLPYDYPRDVLTTYFQWMETALVHAYLIHNSRSEIMFSLSHLHYERQPIVQRVFPEYNPAPGIDGLQPEQGEQGHFPSSLYFQTR